MKNTRTIGRSPPIAASTVGHLDVLINNATRGPDFGTRSALDVDLDWARSAFAVDVFGCWGFVQALLPLLRRAPAARIVNVSSAAARQIGPKLTADLRAPAYALAKYTLNVLTTALAAALADTPILVNAVDPGSFTSHPERGDDGGDPSAAEAAKGVIWAATLEAGGPTGGFFRDGEPVSEGALGRS
jgi:NAD(P)-dependent dehydrogenase (short-subunit alcohol dehydrogenase family)